MDIVIFKVLRGIVPLIILIVVLNSGCSNPASGSDLCDKINLTETSFSISGAGASAHVYSIEYDSFNRWVSFNFDCGDYSGIVSNIAYSNGMATGYKVLFVKPIGQPTCIHGTPAPDPPKSSTVSCMVNTGDGSLLIGTPGAGIYRSLDEGLSWTAAGNGISSTAQVIGLSAGASGKIAAIAAGYADYDSIYLSTNNGKNWTIVPAPFKVFFVLSAVYVNSNGAILAGNYHGLWRTEDNGATWKCLDSVFSKDCVDAITMDSLGYIYVLDRNKIIRSTDDGLSWVQIYLAPATGTQSSLFVTHNNKIIAALGDSTVISADNGSTWNKIYNSKFNAVAMDTGNILYAAVSTTVHKSIDGGKTWTGVGTNVPANSVTALIVNANSHLFAGTVTKGVYLYNGTAWVARNSGLIP